MINRVLTAWQAFWHKTEEQKHKQKQLKTVFSRTKCLLEHYSAHLLKDVLVIYVLEHCDEARQLVLHLILCHSLCRLFQQIVTVFRQLRRHARRRHDLVKTLFRQVCLCVFV